MTEFMSCLASKTKCIIFFSLFLINFCGPSFFSSVAKADIDGEFPHTSQENPYNAFPLETAEQQFFYYTTLSYLDLISFKLKKDPKILRRSATVQWFMRRWRNVINSQRFAAFKVQVMAKHHPDFLLIKYILKYIRMVFIPGLVVKIAGPKWLVLSAVDFAGKVLEFMYIRSKLLYFDWKGYRTYGHRISKLNQLAGEIFNTTTVVDINRHTIVHPNGVTYSLFTRRRRIGEFVRNTAAKLSRGRISSAEETRSRFTRDLERMVLSQDQRYTEGISAEDFLFFARAYMAQDYAYEEVLIYKILQDPLTAEEFFKLVKKYGIAKSEQEASSAKGVLLFLHEETARSYDVVLQAHEEVNRELRRILAKSSGAYLSHLRPLYSHPATTAAKFLHRKYRKEMASKLEHLQDLHFQVLAQLMDQGGGNQARLDNPDEIRKRAQVLVDQLNKAENKLIEFVRDLRAIKHPQDLFLYLDQRKDTPFKLKSGSCPSLLSVLTQS